MSANNYCTCRHSKPQSFRKLGDDWVHTECNLPSKLWVETVMLPRIIAGPRYPELKNHVKVFIQRMNARYWQEVNDVASRYLIPAGIVASMMEHSNIEGNYLDAN